MSKSKSPITSALIAMSGQDNVITIYRPFVEFTGSYEGAALLSQLLYWTPKSKMGGWIAKSDAEFSHELCITPYGLRKARTELEAMGVLKTMLKKFNGAPTLHYFIDLEILEDKFSAYIDGARFYENDKSILRNQQMDFANSQNGFDEFDKSLTETTSETTSENDDDKAAQKNQSRPNSFRAFEQEIGPLTPMVAETLKDFEQTYSEQWTVAAIREASAHGARNLAYITAVLKGWKANGFGNRPQDRKKSPIASQHEMTIDEMLEASVKP